MKNTRERSFLKDVLYLAFTSFGGPQVHFVLYLKRLVNEKKYLTKEELLEIQALCSVLPGPTSTQIITAIGFKIGGSALAYLTLIVWIMPAVIIMTAAATYVPDELKLQMAVGARMVLPVGKDGETQKLHVIDRTAEGFIEKTVHDVRFVPLVSGIV